MFLAEFLYRALREEAENGPLFAYLEQMCIRDRANAEAVQQGMLHSAKKVTGPIKKRPQKKEDPAVRNVACLLYTSRCV